MKSLKGQFIIGVEGGGTKTIAVLADLRGKILKKNQGKSSHLRNFGLKKAIKNLAETIEKIIPEKKRIAATFIGLPAIAEEYKFRIEEIKKELQKERKILKIFEGKVKIGSDQECSFRAGADSDGVMLNAGTGCVSHGWRGDKEAHASGWGWLNDEGGCFFVGHRVFQAILKEIDGRGEKTLLTKMIFKKFNLRTPEDLLNLVYPKFPEILPSFSFVADAAAKKNDKIAKKILEESAEEVALAGKAVIKNLGFKNEKFPIVLVGGLFKSQFFLQRVKKIIKNFSPNAHFILLKKPPVIGAIKLARELLLDK